MVRTVEALIDERGRVELLEPLNLPYARRALVTILEEAPLSTMTDALLSEPALAKDWDREEEEAAWSYLQSEP